MQPATIEIGTSGWKFDDWAGPFYPVRVPQSRWLEYYAARFSIGEINSTYYRIAPRSVYAAIARKTPDHFRVLAKVHADVTHKRQDPDGSLRALQAALQPLRESGKLIGLLAQFPGGFHLGPESLEYVARLRDQCEGENLCTEFRHRSWLCDEAIESLRSAGITWVCPDEPELPDLLPFKLVTTTDLLYVRLHGRNAPAWRNPRVGDRYDYDYSESELTSLGERLLDFQAPVTRAYVLFNNCYAGQAPRNAWWLKAWLARRQNPAADTSLHEPFTLSTD